MGGAGVAWEDTMTSVIIRTLCATTMCAKNSVLLFVLETLALSKIKLAALASQAQQTNRIVAATESGGRTSYAPPPPPAPLRSCHRLTRVLDGIARSNIRLAALACTAQETQRGVAAEDGGGRVRPIRAPPPTVMDGIALSTIRFAALACQAQQTKRIVAAEDGGRRVLVRAPPPPPPRHRPPFVMDGIARSNIRLAALACQAQETKRIVAAMDGGVRARPIRAPPPRVLDGIALLTIRLAALACQAQETKRIVAAEDGGRRVLFRA